MSLAEAVTTPVAKFTWRAAVKWGVGMVVLCAVSWLVWDKFTEQLDSNSAEAKANSTFIREQLLEQNKRQGKMLALAT